MKIALIGEYSGFHNNLKDGLLALGHEAVIASRGDGYKSFDSDIFLSSTYQNKFLNYVDVFRKHLSLPGKLADFDIIQLINPCFVSYANLLPNKIIFDKLINQNKNIFLVGAGEDPVILQYWRNPENRKKLKYSWAEGQKEDIAGTVYEKNLLSRNFLLWNEEVVERIKGYIPIMFEYDQPYKKYNIRKEAIPIAINTDKIDYRENKVNNKLVVFHGLNREGVKGTKYVRQAFESLRNKYPNDLELVIDGKMPYNEYLSLLQRANVVVDQVLSYSLSMNSLISMAQGKVVLGGNEKESFDLMNYEFNPAINIIPDSSFIAAEIEKLLDNRNEIENIGFKSRQFVEKYHNHIDIAKKYIEFWKGKK